MSPKELLYIEDALGHTQYLMTQCRTAPYCASRRSSFSTAIRDCSQSFTSLYKEARQ